MLYMLLATYYLKNVASKMLLSVCPALSEMLLGTCCIVHAVHVARHVASNILLESKMLPSVCA